MINQPPLDQLLPGGLLSPGLELLSDAREDYALHNDKLITSKEFPQPLKDLIDKTIKERPSADQALTALGLKDPERRRHQWLLCNTSNLDFIPDVPADLSRINTEYVACSQRGICPFEGKLCQGVEAKNGKLTIRELGVMGLIRKGDYDKEICDSLNISNDTLKSHKKNIQRKLGVERKSAIANAAALMQII